MAFERGGTLICVLRLVLFYLLFKRLQDMKVAKKNVISVNYYLLVSIILAQSPLRLSVEGSENFGAPLMTKSLMLEQQSCVFLWRQSVVWGGEPRRNPRRFSMSGRRSPWEVLVRMSERNWGILNDGENFLLSLAVNPFYCGLWNACIDYAWRWRCQWLSCCSRLPYPMCKQPLLIFVLHAACLLEVLFYVVNAHVIDFISVGRECSDWPSCTQVLICSEFSRSAKWCCSTHDRHSWKGNYNVTGRKWILQYTSRFTILEMVLLFCQERIRARNVSAVRHLPFEKSTSYSGFSMATQECFQAPNLLFLELWNIWICS